MTRRTTFLTGPAVSGPDRLKRPPITRRHRGCMGVVMGAVNYCCLCCQRVEDRDVDEI